MSDQRHRYPAIPVPDERPAALVKFAEAVRQRLEIFSRDRGRVEDSMVSVDDLLRLGLIEPADLSKLRR